MFDQGMFLGNGDFGTGEVVFALENAAWRVHVDVWVIAKSNIFIKNQTFSALFEDAFAISALRVSES